MGTASHHLVAWPCGQRRWLETLAATCERVLAEQTEGHDAGVRPVLEDLENLLTRLRAELEAPA